MAITMMLMIPKVAIISDNDISADGQEEMTMSSKWEMRLCCVWRESNLGSSSFHKRESNGVRLCSTQNTLLYANTNRQRQRQKQRQRQRQRQTNRETDQRTQWRKSYLNFEYADTHIHRRDAHKIVTGIDVQMGSLRFLHLRELWIIWEVGHTWKFLGSHFFQLWGGAMSILLKRV